MGSEITYAEVNFKNGPSPIQPKASSENKPPPTGFQKLPPWVPWVASGVLLLLSIVLLVVIFVFLWGNSSNVDPKSQIANATVWHCLLKRPGGKEQLSCCLPDWVQNGSSCYYFSQNKMNWSDSEQNCTQMGSNLVIINSEEEQDFLKRHAEFMLKEFVVEDTGFWIGLSIEDGQGTWQWVDKTPLNDKAKFWRKGEPSKGKEKCVVMHTKEGKYNNNNLNWNDIECTIPSPRICEAKSITFH